MQLIHLRESMSSMEAGNAAKEGILKACDAEAAVKPLADGGIGMNVIFRPLWERSRLYGV